MRGPFGGALRRLPRGSAVSTPASQHACRFSKLIRYDVGYYQSFADEVIAQLLTALTTVIHGEFYPGHILYGRGRICPVNWESAAVARGELDLASVTDGWSARLRAACVREYTTARWPDGVIPTEFRRTFAAARLYSAFRWLGESLNRFHGTEGPRAGSRACGRTRDDGH